MKIAVAGGTGVVGRHVTAVLREGGHEAVVLARSAGVDLTTADGVASALGGVAAVVDVTGTATQSSTRSREFFSTVTSNLLEAERAAGVGHHLLLGIVGSDRAPFGYYAGKRAQERLVEAGPISWTILRTTQFHEFAIQIYGSISAGPLHLIPAMRSQPVAAREVAERLVELATGAPQGHVRDLAGPEELRMIDMVRRYAAAARTPGRLLQISVPGGFGRALRDGTLVPVGAHDTSTTTFEAWLSETFPASKPAS